MNRIVLLGVMALSGCSHPHEPIATDFGNSVNANIAAQRVNPPKPTYAPIETDGQHVNNALVRYHNDKVYQPHLPLETGRVHGGAQPMPSAQ